MEEAINRICIILQNKIDVMEKGMECLKQNNMHHTPTYLNKQGKVSAYSDCIIILSKELFKKQ